MRQRPVRAEYLVPVAALLLLVLALILSYAPSDPAVDQTDPAVEPGVAELGDTATAPGDGYPIGTAPAALAETSSVIRLTPLPSGTTSISETDGYPGPGGIDGPVGVGTPVAGGINPGGEDLPTPFSAGATPSFPAPGSSGSFSTPVIPNRPGGSGVSATPVIPRNPDDLGSGYPSPDQSDLDFPSGQTPPGPALIPTPTPAAPRSKPPIPAPPPRSNPLLPPNPAPRSSAPPRAAPPATIPSPVIPGDDDSGYPAPEDDNTPSAAPTQPQPRSPGATSVVAPTPGRPSGPEGATTTTPAPAGTEAATSAPEPGNELAPPPAEAPTEEPTPEPPTATPEPPTPTLEPITRIEGEVRWSAAESPILVEQDTVVTPGGSLIVDPGVEVRLRPGVDIVVEGQLRAVASGGAPIRFVGPEGRWTGIIGQPGSAVVLENAQLRNAGRDGVAVSSTEGQLTLREVLITDSGGGVATTGAAVDMRGVQITGNNVASGPAVNIAMGPEAPITLQGSIVGGNLVPHGTPQVRLVARDNGSGPVDIQGNAFVGGAGTLLDIQAATGIGGTIRCNGFRDGTIGFQLSASTPSGQGFSLAVDNNAFEGQTTAGVASTVGLDAGSNWWGDPSGPFDAERNPQGRGARVGVNVGFQPPLAARPDCAPVP